MVGLPKTSKIRPSSIETFGFQDSPILKKPW